MILIPLLWHLLCQHEADKMSSICYARSNNPGKDVKTVDLTCLPSKARQLGLFGSPLLWVLGLDNSGFSGMNNSSENGGMHKIPQSSKRQSVYLQNSLVSSV